jgi:uncharacterized protein (DUF2236 family)
MAALDLLRQRAHDALRGRVAGPDAQRVAEEIWQRPGPRRFTPDDPVWIVHADAAMFVGGLRALLLQSLHPLAMHGVAHHSDYRRDPWGRLQRTSQFLAATTFGTAETAEQAIARVRAVHHRVTGTTSRGVPYSAADPHLLGWVHVAEIDSFLAAHQQYGARPLSATEVDLYVSQTAMTAAALGVIDPPTSRAALDDSLRGYRRELRGSAAARDAARFLTLHPPLPLMVRPAYATLAAGAIELLPVWARRQLRLAQLPGAAPAARAGCRSFIATVRWAMGAEAAHRTGTLDRSAS